MSKDRVVCWFSCGAASAVAAKVALDDCRKRGVECVIVRIHLENEHPDSARFAADCEQWFGQEIVTLKDDQFGANVDTVIEKLRFMAGVYGAACTTRLKKNVRIKWQQETDIHVFGMTSEEAHRIDNLQDSEPDLKLWPVLIDCGITKKDCFEIVHDVGIKLPKMYELGYSNNNCIGCLKASSATYWNMIRRDFPEVYARRADQEKELGVSMVLLGRKKFERQFPDVIPAINMEEKERDINILKNRKDGRVYIPLRYLPETAGKGGSAAVGACGLLCDADESRKKLFDQ